MPPDLASDTRRRLVNVLGMLGSSHAGERDAAGLAAHRIVRGAGLTWDALVTVPRVERQSEPPPPPRDPPAMDWRELARRCAANPSWLTEWERVFLAGLPRWPRLSAKQRAVLSGIALQLRARGVPL